MKCEIEVEQLLCNFVLQKKIDVILIFVCMMVCVWRLMMNWVFYVIVQWDIVVYIVKVGYVNFYEFMVIFDWQYINVILVYFV